MKNLDVFVERAEIHEYVQSLWKTDFFRDHHRKVYSPIWTAVNELSWLPRFFCDMSNDHLERAHFSTWWGVITRRYDYDNPYIHDLYYLHEFYHAAHMPYMPGMGKAAFDEKMQRNELEASVASEIAIYFDLPNLRWMSFNQPIYADRFLNDPSMRRLWACNRSVAMETIRTMRRDVMLSKPEHTMDVSERWIRRFAEQNAMYSIVWGDRYDEIETRMHLVFQGVAGGLRREAAGLHEAWLRKEAAKDRADNIPFRREAELFAPFYWANKDKYTQELMKGKAA